ncbi:MAG: hypothetical protein U1F43_25775 [Myxococcota bacterium]
MPRLAARISRKWFTWSDGLDAGEDVVGGGLGLPPRGRHAIELEEADRLGAAEVGVDGRRSGRAQRVDGADDQRHLADVGAERAHRRARRDVRHDAVVDDHLHEQVRAAWPSMRSWMTCGAQFTGSPASTNACATGARRTSASSLPATEASRFLKVAKSGGIGDDRRDARAEDREDAGADAVRQRAEVAAMMPPRLMPQ